METAGKFVVIYSSEQERFVTPHGLYLGEKVPAVETPERTKSLVQRLVESGTTKSATPFVHPSSVGSASADPRSRSTLKSQSAKIASFIFIVKIKNQKILI
jgi:hypothetical protein